MTENKTSLLQRYERMLGYSQSPMSEDDRRELAKIAARDLPPLKLRDDKRSLPWKAVGALALAAGLSLVIWQAGQGPKDTLTVKGGDGVSVLVVSGATLRPLAAGEFLAADEPFVVKIKPKFDGVAWLEFFSATGEGLEDLTTVTASATEVKRQVSAPLGGTYRLDATNQHEILRVLLCPRAMPADSVKRLLQSASATATDGSWRPLTSGCEVSTIGLR